MQKHDLSPNISIPVPDPLVPSSREWRVSGTTDSPAESYDGSFMYTVYIYTLYLGRGADQCLAQSGERKSGRAGEEREG